MHVFRPAALGVALMAAVGMANAAPDVPTADARGVAISEAAYPGTIVLEVDATDLGQRVFKVRQTVPVPPASSMFQPVKVACCFSCSVVLPVTPV